MLLLHELNLGFVRETLGLQLAILAYECQFVLLQLMDSLTVDLEDSFLFSELLLNKLLLFDFFFEVIVPQILHFKVVLDLLELG